LKAFGIQSIEDEGSGNASLDEIVCGDVGEVDVDLLAIKKSRNESKYRGIKDIVRARIYRY
jgi:hypothetical protein